MKQKLIAIAVAGSFALPAAAFAQATVSIYGTIHNSFENVKAGGTGAIAGLPSRNRVSQNSSNIGFRGVENLGGGLRAFFQVESNVGADGTGATNTFGSRNTQVGLGGSWGSAFLGNWDTPYKSSTNTTLIDPFGNTGLGGHSGIMEGGLAQFDLRRPNSVQYWTPKLNGFEGRVAYVTGEVNTVPAGKPSDWSVAGTYTSGPIYLLAAYERHKDVGARGIDQKGWKVGGSYTFAGTTMVSLVYNKLDFDRSATTSFDRDAWAISASHKIGAGQIRAAYRRADDTSGTGTALGPFGAPATVGGTGAKQWVIGYAHSLSKRTELYALYSKINNDAGAAYDFATNAIGAVAGQDPKGFALGLKHGF